MQVKFRKTGKKGYAQLNRIQILKNCANTGNNMLSCAALGPQKTGSDWSGTGVLLQMVCPQVNWMFQQPATLELTHNWGTESDPDSKMHNGNDKPQGYGHIG